MQIGRVSAVSSKLVLELTVIIACADHSTPKAQPEFDPQVRHGHIFAGCENSNEQIDTALGVTERTIAEFSHSFRHLLW